MIMRMGYLLPFLVFVSCGLPDFDALNNIEAGKEGKYVFPLPSYVFSEQNDIIRFSDYSEKLGRITILNTSSSVDGKATSNQEIGPFETNTGIDLLDGENPIVDASVGNFSELGFTETSIHSGSLEIVFSYSSSSDSQVRVVFSNLLDPDGRPFAKDYTLPKENSEQVYTEDISKYTIRPNSNQFYVNTIATVQVKSGEVISNFFINPEIRFKDIEYDVFKGRIGNQIIELGTLESNISNLIREDSKIQFGSSGYELRLLITNPLGIPIRVKIDDFLFTTDKGNVPLILDNNESKSLLGDFVYILEGAIFDQDGTSIIPSSLEVIFDDVNSNIGEIFQDNISKVTYKNSLELNPTEGFSASNFIKREKSVLINFKVKLPLIYKL